MTHDEYTRQYAQARWGGTHRVIQGKIHIRAEYKRVMATITPVVRDYSDAPNLDALLQTAIPKKRMYQSMAQIMRDGIVKETRSVTDIDRRYIFDILKKSRAGDKISKEKIKTMYDSMPLDTVKAQDALIDTYRYDNTNDPADYFERIIALAAKNAEKHKKIQFLPDFASTKETS